MRRGFTTISDTMKEYIFPLFCLSCDQEGEWVCASCFEHHFSFCGVFYCPICHVETTDGEVCGTQCREKSFLSQHTALLPYAENALIARLLHSLKYQYAESTISLFARIIEQWTKTTEKFSAIDCITPVPLHKKRYAERGFNQAEILARMLASQTGILFFDGAKRVKETAQQATLSKQEREKNVGEAFVALPGVAGKVVLLVDDVFTTGSTMQECAAALKKAGAREVRGFSIARG